VNRVLTTSAVLLLSTCAAAQPDVAAVIDKPTKESRAELAQALSGALNGAPVTIADDALTQDSLLIIERPLSGRDLGKPEHFRLVKTGEHCALVHERTGKRTTLASTTCRPQ
jgi:hypothetical protein